MFEKTLARVWTTCAKHALSVREDIVWEDFVRAQKSDIRVVADPFPHIIIDDFFKDWVYEDLSRSFTKAQEHGYSDSVHEPGRFHKFEIDYDGYVFIPAPTLDRKSGLSLFYSLEWNFFFAKLFKRHTSFETSLAFHHHPPGNRTGFVHHDFADKKFPDIRLKNGVVPFALPDMKEGRTCKRVIALIYFLNNDGWRDGDGGETGLYAKDAKTLVASVAPRNNRLFAFSISPESFHAFQENRNDRNSIIQWFHAPHNIL